MTIEDEGQEVIQTFMEVQDSVSRLLGARDGVSFCGARKYELIDEELHSAYLSLNGRIITGTSVDNSVIGEHRVQLKVSLFDQPDIFKIAEFMVTVNPCQVTDFNIELVPLSQEYTVTADKLKMGTFTVYQGACSHPVTFELVEPLPFVTFDQSSRAMFV